VSAARVKEALAFYQAHRAEIDARHSGRQPNSSWRVSRPRLHLEADTSIRQLQRALLDRGH